MRGAEPLGGGGEALRRGNGTAFGRVAGVWANDGERQRRRGRRLRFVQVFVNNYGGGGGSELPFGGVKASGYGREMGHEGIDSYTDTQSIAVAPKSKGA